MREPFLIVWNQENIYGYHMLPRNLSALKVWAENSESAVESATVRIMSLLTKQLGDIDCTAELMSNGSMEIIAKEVNDKRVIARVFDIHEFLTL